MTTNIEYRPIQEFPDYQIGIDRHVWSIPRQRPGKSGSLRTLQGRRLKPDAANRVWLNREGTRERHNVDDLFRQHFPETHYPKPQTHCREGHRLALAHLWGAGNRVCAQCFPDWTPPTVQRVRDAAPRYWAALPLRGQDDKPIGVQHLRETVGRLTVKPDDEDDDTGDLLAAGHGFIPERFSRTSGHVPFPPVCMVPDRLRRYDALMRRRP